MVSLLTELPVSGDIFTSADIDSVTIYRITTFMDYVIMTFEVIYFIQYVSKYFCVYALHTTLYANIILSNKGFFNN